jgi:hypothetical protein
MGSFLSREDDESMKNDDNLEYVDNEDTDYLIEEQVVKRSSKKNKTRSKRKIGGRTKRAKY